MNIKYLIGASAAAILAFSTASNAADVVGGPEAPIALAFDWSGGYIGVNLGGGFGKFKHPVEVTAVGAPGPLMDGSVGLTAGGFLGGVQAGYNWQSGQMVYGVEADFQGSSVKGEGSIDVGGLLLGGAALTGEAGTKVDWFGTLRARIGYTPVDRFMVYTTGGLAYGHVKSYVSANVAGLGGIDLSKSETKAGWKVGGGAEYALTNNWTLKSEYLYTDLGKTTLYSGDIIGAGTNTTLKNDVAFHTVRIGLNYKF